MIQHWSFAAISANRSCHLLFSGMCLAIIVTAVFGARNMHATDPVEFIRFLRANLGAALLLVALFLWFVAEYTGKRHVPSLILATALIAVLFAVNLVQPYTLQYARFDGIQTLQLGWGETLTRGNGSSGPWTYAAVAAVLAVFGYAMYALFDFRLRTRRPSAVWMLAAAGLFIGCAVEGILVRLSIIHFVVLGPYGFLLMVSVMGAALTREMHHQLRTSEETFRAILRNASDGVHVIDADGNVIEVSNAFCDMLGYSREEVLTMNASQWDRRFSNTAFRDEIKLQLARPVRSQVEVRHRRKDGSVLDVEISGFPLEIAGKPVMFNSSRDITERKANQKRIRHLAFYDQLTGLPNRRLLDDRLGQTLSASARTGRRGALLLIDLDNFKTVNDSAGHPCGDLMLTQAAERLSALVRRDDVVARLGGDEFVVLLANLGQDDKEAAHHAKVVGEKVLRVLSRPYGLGIRDFRSSCSIGITVFRGHENAPEELIKQADIAMYEAKNGGRNHLRFFNPDMQAEIDMRAAFESDLHKALQEGQLALHYQVQVDGKGRPFGAEALLRWLHPERGPVPPDRFIPLAEDTGMILPIGQWVLETACAQLARWRRDPATRHLVLAINVSSRQLLNSDFPQQVRSAARRHGVDPSRLMLELTESTLLEDTEHVVAGMRALRDLGVGFSLDDFGTGYSSLQYLKRLPLDQLKIDRSFVRDIGTDSNDTAIVRTIVAIAQSLGLAVIAEGVETRVQHRLLLDTGCTQFQGYLFARPVPAAQLEGLLEQRTPPEPTWPAPVPAADESTVR